MALRGLDELPAPLDGGVVDHVALARHGYNVPSNTGIARGVIEKWPRPGRTSKRAPGTIDGVCSAHAASVT